MIKISIVIGSYNRLKFLKKTLESIRSEINSISKSSFTWEIIIVDGGSTDGTIPYLVDQKDIILILQHNRGKWLGDEIKRKSWGYFMNLGFRASSSKYVVMLSDDCLVVPGAIVNSVYEFEELSKSKKVGALAYWWRNWPEEKEYLIGKAFGRFLYVNHGIYLRSALKDVNYLDEDNYFFYHADSDVCLKMYDKGYEVLPATSSFVEHYSHANLKVRYSNFTKKTEDYEAYHKIWKHLFIESEKDNSGHGWLSNNFEDKTMTASLFVPLHRITRIKNFWYLSILHTKIYLKNFIDRLLTFKSSKQ